MELCDRVLSAYSTSAGRGLPIGALTSQHFANLYLAPFDRYLLEELEVGGLVRYMDDVVVWGETSQRLRDVLRACEEFVEEGLRLEIKPNWQIQRTFRGLTLCGFRVFSRKLALSQRRRRRYRQARVSWESAYLSGAIDARTLQEAYAGVLAITTGAQSLAWRRGELARRPAVEV